MPLSARDFVDLVLQATVLLVASAALVRGLIWLLRSASPAVQRIAWLLVLVQGVMLVRLPVHVRWYAPAAMPPVAYHEAPQPNLAVPPRESAMPLEDVVGPAVAASEPPGIAPDAPAELEQTNPAVVPPVDSSEASAAGSFLPTAYGLLLVWAAGIVLVPVYGTLKYLRFLRRIRGIDSGEESWTAQWRNLLAAKGKTAAAARRYPVLRAHPGCWAGAVPLALGLCGAGAGRRVARAERRSAGRGPAARVGALRAGRPVEIARRAAVGVAALVQSIGLVGGAEVRRMHRVALRRRGRRRPPRGPRLRPSPGPHRHAGLAQASVLNAARGRLFHRIRRLVAADPREDSTMKKTLLVVAASLLVLFGAIRIQLVAKEPSEPPPVSDAAASGSPAAPTVPGPTAAADADQARAIAEIEKLGRKVVVDEKSPGKPVIGVDLRLAKVTDAWMVHLKGLTALQTLSLRQTKVTDAGLVYLEDLTRLQTLFLDDTQVTDAGLVHLKGLTKLQRLDLTKTKVADAGLVHLKGLAQLQDLHLARTQVTDAGLVHLKGLTSLQTLVLGETRVTDAGLVQLEALEQLQWLGLTGTQVTDAGLPHLEGLTGLQVLFLNDTRVTDAGLVHLKALTELQTLNLRQTKVTDAGLAHLEGLTRLQTLFLNDTKVTDAGLVHLKGLTRLRSLELAGTKVADAGLVHLKRLTGLRYLSLRNTPVTDAGLVHLEGLTQLQTLDLMGATVTDAGVARLAKALPKCKISQYVTVPPPVPPAASPAAKPATPAASAAADEPLARRSGVVVDGTGAPVAGCKVWAVHAELVKGTTETLDQATTDAQGRFAFAPEKLAPSPEKPGMVYYFARDAKGRIGWPSLPRRQPGETGEKDLEGQLFEVQDYRGRIVDAAGAPIAKAAVRPIDLTAGESGQRTANSLGVIPPELLKEIGGETGPDGGFVLHGVPPQGSASAIVTAAGFGSQRASWNLGKPVTMELARTGSIRGTLACAENPQAAAKMQLRIWRMSSPGSRSADASVGFQTEVTTDQAGGFSIAEAPAGEYAMQLSSVAPGAYYPELPKSIEVKAGQTTAVSIAVRRSLVVRGQVVDAKTGAGVKDTALGLRWTPATTTTPSSATAHTDAEGNFQVYVTPGRIRIEVSPAPGYLYPPLSSPSNVLEVTEDTTLPTIRLNPAGVLEGVVVDEAGKPVAGAEVGFDFPMSNSQTLPRPIRSDPNGRFSLATQAAARELLGGSAIVAVDRERKLHGHAPLPDGSLPGAANKPLEIRLLPTGVVRAACWRATSRSPAHWLDSSSSNRPARPDRSGPPSKSWRRPARTGDSSSPWSRPASGSL